MGAEFHAEQITAGRDIAGRDIVHNYQIIIHMLGADAANPAISDAQIGNFLEYHLGTAEHAVAFAGRDVELKALDDWLSGTRPYRMIVAPAGRGKSALVSHWLARLAENAAQARTRVVFAPISIRYRTNLEGTVLATVCARVAQIYNVTTPLERDVNELRRFLATQLRKPPPGASQLLMVLDGLDEAAGWSPGSDLFPSIPPKHLRILVTARPLVGDSELTAWRLRLNWSAQVAEVSTLDMLDRGDYSGIVASAGLAYASRAQDDQFLDQLFRLSGGDPLLLRLYLDALLPILETKAPLSARDLESINPGLNDVFRLMFDEQKKVWSNPLAFPERPARNLLAACSAALGPLTRSDLTAIDTESFPDSDTVDRAASVWSRILIGDGIALGYVFGHPRMADDRWKQLSVSEQAKWRAAFLAYGKRSREVLYAGGCAPHDVPDYVVRYYGAHVRQVPADREEAYALLHRSWFDAWMAVEGSAGGFLNDVSAASKLASAQQFDELEVVFRAALMRASVGSAVAELYALALEQCLLGGALDARAALSLSRQHQRPEWRTPCLAVAAPFLVNEAERLGVWRECFQTLMTAQPDDRVMFLRELAPRAPKDLFPEALHVLKSVPVADQLACWVGVVQMLEGQAREAAVEEAVGTLSHDDSYAVLKLCELARRLPQPLRDSVSGRALDLVTQLPEGEKRALAFVAAANVRDADRHSLLDRAMEQVEGSIDGLHNRARACRDIGKWLDALRAREVKVLLPHMRYLDDHELQEALVWWPDKMADEEAARMSLQLLKSFRVDDDLVARAALIGRLPVAERKGLLDELWAKGQVADQPADRVDLQAEILAATVSPLPARLEELFGWLLELNPYDRRRIFKRRLRAMFALDPQRAQAIAESMEHAGPLLVAGVSAVQGVPRLRIARAALRVFCSIGDRVPQCEFLARAAGLVEADRRREIIGDVLDAVSGVDDDDLLGILDYLPEPLDGDDISVAIKLADRITDAHKRTACIGRLAARYPADLYERFIWKWVTSERSDVAGIMMSGLQKPTPREIAAHVPAADIFMFLISASNGDPYVFHHALSGLAGRISRPEDVELATRLAHEASEQIGVRPLVALAQAVRPVSQELLDELKGRLREEDGELDLIRALGELVPSEQVIDVVHLVGQQDSVVNRSEALEAMGARLAPEHAELFSSKVREVLGWNPFFMIAPLASVAVHLSPAVRAGVLAECVKLLRGSSYTPDRVRATIALGRVLEPSNALDEWARTLAALGAEERMSELKSLGLVNTPYLNGFRIIAESGPAKLLPACMRAVEEQGFWSDTELLLKSVARRWDEIVKCPDWDHQQGLQQLLTYLATQSRTAVLRGFAPFLVPASRLITKEQVEVMVVSVKKAAEWWP